MRQRDPLSFVIGFGIYFFIMVIFMGFLVGCGKTCDASRGYEKAYRSTYFRGLSTRFDPADIGIIHDHVRDYLETTMGWDLTDYWANISHLNVCITFQEGPAYYKGVPYNGLTYSSNDVIVRMGGFNRLVHTALKHEFVHIIEKNTEYDGRNVQHVMDGRWGAEEYTLEVMKHYE